MRTSTAAQLERAPWIESSTLPSALPLLLRFISISSQEPDASADVSNPNGQNSSYDYAAEEREFQANRTKPNRISGQRKNRMSVDNKAYKPSVSEGKSSEEYPDDAPNHVCR